LLSGKLTEQFGRPSMAVHVKGTECSASLRSPACYNIVEGLERCAHLLTTYGGHAQAAGCTFKTDVLPLLRDQLTADVASRTAPEDLVPTLMLDGCIDPRHLTPALCKEIAALGPFGQANAEPMLYLPGILLSGVRTVGGDGQHLQGMAGGCKVIGFHLGSHASKLGAPVDLACRVGIDTWNGRNSVQLTVADIRPEQVEIVSRSAENVQLTMNN
jgi:single-stranded-DNA-specific exonuclease